jgi:HD superfamily phosphohydrolase
VNEGVIAYDRIIKMLTVKDGVLMVEEKGIYSIENFLIVVGALNSNQELQTHANTLKQLIGARAWVLMAKVHLLEEYVNKVGKDDSAAKVELRESRIERDQYAGTYGNDV